MVDSSSAPPQPGASSGFPLGALLLLVAVVGVLMGMVATLSEAVKSDDVPGEQVALASILGGVVIGLMGSIVGLYHHRRIRGIGLGIVLGGGIGLVTGPLMLVPEADFTRTLLVAAFGSILILTGAGFIRVTSSRGNVELPTSEDEFRMTPRKTADPNSEGPEAAEGGISAGMRTETPAIPSAAARRKPVSNLRGLAFGFLYLIGSWFGLVLLATLIPPNISWPPRTFATLASPVIFVLISVPLGIFGCLYHRRG